MAALLLLFGSVDFRCFFNNLHNRTEMYLKMCAEYNYSQRDANKCLTRAN